MYPDLTLLALNLGLLPTVGNWWALFLVIPVVAPTVQAWARYQDDGAVTRRVLEPLYGAMFR